MIELNNMVFIPTQDVLKHKLKLSRISINDNPLHCDCNLYWMINVIRAGWIIFQHRDKIKCRHVFS